VAAAERAVGRFRRALDHSAAGVPAHVTVLYPLVPPHRIDAGTIEEIGAALAEIPAFSCTFSEVKWSGDDELPITTRIDHARLIAGSDAPDSWRTVAEFPLPG
jgi:hypothetical protein